MKRLSILLVLLSMALATTSLKLPKVEFKTPDQDWDIFVEALIFVESTNNPNAVGDNGKAVGCLQIWPILVDEVNRISKGNYTYDDRYSRDKSIEMFNIIQNKRNKDKDLVKACYVWNPTAGSWYSNKVLAKYKELYYSKYHVNQEKYN